MAQVKYKNKYHMSEEQNRRFVKKNLVNLVFVTSRFEGLTTTLPQTKTIIDGMGVSGVSIDDINVIVQLKRGWQYIINQKQKLSLEMEKDINKIVALHDALIPGEIRSGNVEVAISEEDTYKPTIPNENAEQEYFRQLMNDTNRTATDKALTLLYHNMRSQLFWDGNKRTAILAANKVMIENGAGLINVPLDKWGKWNELISEFYRTNNMNTLKEWTYENGIHGVDLS